MSLDGPGGTTAVEKAMDDSAPGVRTVFADELEAHCAELVDAGVQRFVGTLPAYAELVQNEGPGPLRDNLTLHLTSVAGIARSPARAAFGNDSAFEVSLRRAQQGFPLEAVLRSAQLMNQLIWDWVMSHPVFEDQRAEFLRNCWPLWLNYVDVLNSESSRAYVAAARETAEQDLMVRRRFVEQLLTARTSTFDTQRTAQALGFEEGVDFRLLLIQFWEKSPNDSLDGQLYEVIERLRPISRTTPPAVTMNDAIVVLLQCPEQSLPQLRTLVASGMEQIGTDVPASAGISRPISGLVQVRRHHDELQQVVRVGRSNRTDVVLAEEISLFDHAISALHETIDQVCPPDLRSFVRNHTKHMSLWHETMTSYAQHHHSVRETAEALHVHPNTVYYRLGQISEASGRDLTSMADFADVWIALNYWRLVYANDS